jgi:hypothetical protein
MCIMRLQNSRGIGFLTRPLQMKLVAIAFETADLWADSACAMGIISIEKGRRGCHSSRARGSWHYGLCHGARREAVELPRSFRLRMVEIHCRAHPDCSEREVVPQFHPESGHVILVFVRHDQEVDMALAIDLWQKWFQVLDCSRKVVGATQRSAVDECVEISPIIVSLRNTAVDAVAKSDVEQSD